jgi:hypothetical protein
VIADASRPHGRDAAFSASCLALKCRNTVTVPAFLFFRLVHAYVRQKIATIVRYLLQEYFSSSILGKFELVFVKEGEDKAIENMIEGAQYPGFLILKMRKKT